MDPTLLSLSRLAHLLGVIFWVGGVVAVALVAAGATAADARSAAGAGRRVVLQLVTPAMLIAWIAGLSLLISSWGEVYAKAGWMHGKLTLALIATALSGVISGRLRRIHAGDASATGVRTLGWVVLVIAFTIATLAVVEPGR